MVRRVIRVSSLVGPSRAQAGSVVAGRNANIVSSSSVALKWSRVELQSLCEPYLTTAPTAASLTREQYRRLFTFVHLVYQTMMPTGSPSGSPAPSPSASSPSSASLLHAALLHVHQNPFLYSASCVQLVCEAFLSARQALGRDHSAARVLLESANILQACAQVCHQSNHRVSQLSPNFGCLVGFGIALMHDFKMVFVLFSGGRSIGALVRDRVASLHSA